MPRILIYFISRRRVHSAKLSARTAGSDWKRQSKLKPSTFQQISRARTALTVSEIKSSAVSKMHTAQHITLWCAVGKLTRPL
jgi:hypothetical protein